MLIEYWQTIQKKKEFDLEMFYYEITNTSTKEIILEREKLLGLIAAVKKNTVDIESALKGAKIKREHIDFMESDREWALDKDHEKREKAFEMGFDLCKKLLLEGANKC